MLGGEPAAAAAGTEKRLTGPPAAARWSHSSTCESRPASQLSVVEAVLLDWPLGTSEDGNWSSKAQALIVAAS